jgi:hypothetical protein
MVLLLAFARARLQALRRQPSDVAAFLANVTNSSPQALISPRAYRLPPGLWDPSEPGSAGDRAGSAVREAGDFPGCGVY